MPDALKRTIRTIVQVGVAAGLTALLGAVQGWSVSPSHSPSLADLKGAAIYVVFAVLVAVVPLVQNLVEDHTAAPALLKEKPTPPPPPH